MSPLVYLIVACILLGYASVVFRVLVRGDYRREGRLTPLSSLLQSLVFFLWGFFTWFDLPADWPTSHTNPSSWVTGWVFIGLGLGAMFTMIAWFGLRRSVGREVNVLKQSSPYRLTRNPQILACLLAVVGYAMLWPSWNSLGWVALFSAFAHMMVLTEEEHLRTIHGDAYKRYCERTPRYLGFTQRPRGTA